MSQEPIRLGRPGRPADHPLITVAETARRLGYSAMTIRRRIEARQFPAVKIGSKAMVPRAFVDRLLAAAASGRTVVVEEIAAQWAAEEAGEQSRGPTDHDRATNESSTPASHRMDLISGRWGQ